MKVLFVAPTATSTGETITAMGLAKDLADAGDKVEFVATPDAARLLKNRFQGKVTELTGNRFTNRTEWDRVVRAFKPDAVVFSEIFTFFTGALAAAYPLADREWLREVSSMDSPILWIDLMGFAGAMRRYALAGLSKGTAARLRFEVVDAFLSQLRVLLPCPLHEPRKVAGRCGIPYRSLALPLRVDMSERREIRSRFVATKDDALIFHTISSWAIKAVQRWRMPLYDFLGELLASYLRRVDRPVTIVSANNGALLRPVQSRRCRILNIKGLPPATFEKLVMSADLVLSENATSYTLAKTIGKVPGISLINSFMLPQIMQSEPEGSASRATALRMESRRPASVFPYRVYPYVQPIGAIGPFLPWRLAPRLTLPADSIRVGGLPSSPHVQAELFDSQKTPAVFESLLCDPAARAKLIDVENSYIARQTEIDDGPSVVRKIVSGQPYPRLMDFDD